MASSNDDAAGSAQDVRVRSLTFAIICTFMYVLQVYGDYEIINAIGKGKFAVVYRAKRISNGEIGTHFLFVAQMILW